MNYNDMAFKYKLRTGEDIPSFEDIFAIEVKTKEEGKENLKGSRYFGANRFSHICGG